MKEQVIRVLIVDDEVLARRILKSLLKNRPDIELAGECRSGMEAVEMIRREKPNLVFLDIQMPEMNGFQVIEALKPEEIPEVIFVTAYDQYAVKAFDIHAIDYLLKPFDDERFEKALERARLHISQNNQNRLSRQLIDFLNQWREKDQFQQLPPERIPVKDHGRISFVAVREIDWVEASDQYVTLHCDKKTYLVRETMNELEARLSSKYFFRIHRSSLVNLQSVTELRVNKQGECHAVVKDGSFLKVSRNKRTEFEEALLQTQSD
jgi:two-component system, LytTR family, response regulator